MWAGLDVSVKTIAKERKRSMILPHFLSCNNVLCDEETQKNTKILGRYNEFYSVHVEFEILLRISSKNKQ